MAKKKERPDDLVVVESTKLKNTAPTTVTRRAFERVWKDKGYKIVGDGPAAPGPSPTGA